jgi:hypothetical protein
MYRYTKQERRKIHCAIRRHFKNGIKDSEELTEALIKDGFLSPDGTKLLSITVRGLRLRAGIRLHRSHNGKPTKVTKPKNGNRIPASVQLIMEDEELTPKQKLKMLAAYLGE